MPRYYFDVREGARFTPDEEGFDFDSVDAAETEAAYTAVEIARDRFPGAREIVVEVRNGHGEGVLTVTVSMTIDRVEPPPMPRR